MARNFASWSHNVQFFQSQKSNFKGFQVLENENQTDQFPILSCRWLQWLLTCSCCGSLELMLNIHKCPPDLNLQQYTELWRAHTHSRIYEYLTSSRGSYCKNETIVNAISGNWEYETGLLQGLLVVFKDLNTCPNKSSESVYVHIYFSLGPTYHIIPPPPISSCLCPTYHPPPPLPHQFQIALYLCVLRVDFDGVIKRLKRCGRVIKLSLTHSRQEINWRGRYWHLHLGIPRSLGKKIRRLRFLLDNTTPSKQKITVC